MLDLDGPLLAALRDLPVPMWLADRLGHVRWLNRAAASLLGDTVGAHFSRYIGPDDVSDARELFARRVEGRLDTAIRRTTLLTTSGALDVELTSVPIRDGDDVVAVVTVVRDAALASSARRRPRPRLTPRQQQMLELLAQGRSTTEIAEELQISTATVRNHVRSLLTELRVRTRIEAVVTAFRNDWL
ncbi:MAG TPA: LuxR C-terminal-related transcriptional regulator [Gaiellaceae bacterium]|nr:LuxR C-terminal-related transcriptional regulator [Gaiellaceae bacterium]